MLLRDSIACSFGQNLTDRPVHPASKKFCCKNRAKSQRNHALSVAFERYSIESELSRFTPETHCQNVLFDSNFDTSMTSFGGIEDSDDFQTLDDLERASSAR